MEREKIEKVRGMLRGSAARSLWHWVRPVRFSVAAICVSAVLVSLLSLGVTLATRELIDGAVSARTDALWAWGAALAALLLTERGLGVGTSLIRSRASARLQRSLQSMLAERLLSRDYGSLRHYHSGELVNRFFSDVGVVKSGMLSILPSFVRIGVSFVGAAAILISMDWRFVLLLIVGGAAGLAMTLAFRNPMKQRHRRMQEAEGKLHASAQETLENVRLIKASLSERRAGRRMEEQQEALESEQVRQGRFSTLMNQGIGLVFDLSWLGCMLFGCARISRGALTYGALAAMIQLIGRIQGPIANAVNLAAQAYSVLASAERLEELTELPGEKRGESLQRFDAIRLEHVSFHYEDSREDVLRGVSCVIPRGTFAAVTGVSGAGKTSLFQLLLGIYSPTEGQVLFETEGRQVPASRDTRSLFAYVPQGNTLLSGTLRENLTLFTDEASEEAIAAAVKAACIEDLTAEIGLDAALQERGGGLSEGQAQRVAIARALLSGAPILLLDEATSALDEETEARVLRNLSEMRNRTCIIVTHRKAALAICDQTLRMEDGRLV